MKLPNCRFQGPAQLPKLHWMEMKRVCTVNNRSFVTQAFRPQHFNNCSAEILRQQCIVLCPFFVHFLSILCPFFVLYVDGSWYSFIVCVCGARTKSRKLQYTNGPSHFLSFFLAGQSYMSRPHMCRNAQKQLNAVECALILFSSSFLNWGFLATAP